MGLDAVADGGVLFVVVLVDDICGVVAVVVVDLRYTVE